MALTPLKVLLFLGGGTVAAGGTAYIAGALDPYFQSQPQAAEAPAPDTQKLAALPPAGTKGDRASAPGQAAAPAAQLPAPPADGTQPAATDAPASQSGVQAPAFDLVRVEADGSIVIAGRAAPNAKVEAVIGSRVIGTATASPGGEFAIILDEPLNAGDYQIVLRSTTPDNVVAMSQETATVSVPESSDGQVLALVEEPGKPSELITVPAPVQPKARQTAGSTTAASGEPQPATIEQKVATASKETQPGRLATEQPNGSKVNVEAVEIEGRKIFVAGSSDAGRLVRAYANEILLGETKTSQGGRFLVEAERDLPVGDYIIRVDALAPNGGKVVARAAVPFEREEGENVAAVASPAAGATPAPDGTQAAAATPPAASGTSQAAGTATADGEAASQQTADPAAGPTTTTSQTATGNAAAGSMEASAQKPAEGASASTDKSASVASGDAAVAASQTTAPKLQSVDGSVIIRRGDSLWRISKRVYGRGMRYSHIYLANQEQIRNPDLIMPGQVFTVPSKTTEGEAADMTKLGEQAVTPAVQQN
jgi:nucleoid-associated protein YgaU